MSIELPIVLTPKQLGDFLGLDKAELSKALRAGRIPGARKAGKRWFIGRDRFLKSVVEANGKSKPSVR